MKCDGQSISYDGAGNPTSYYNGTRWSFTWGNGRSQTAASGGGKTLSFTYDLQDGTRSTKTVGTEVHNYIYAGGKLLRETYGNTTLDFIYDVNGRPYAMIVNESTTYYYITNLQGDVIYMIDSSGETVASYEYDPYGNVTGTGSMANTNPLRYRGYYYDAETQMYYLQSRYYDPAVGRFINADVYASTGQGIIGNNMFAYCSNSPISGYDPAGHYGVSCGNNNLNHFMLLDARPPIGKEKEVIVISNSSSGWMSSSQKMGDDMASAIGANSSQVVGVTTSSFIDTWNNTTASHVIIHTHGTPDALVGDSFSFRTANIGRINVNANINLVVITACQVGGDNGSRANMGQSISRKISSSGYVICCTDYVSGADTYFRPKTTSGNWVVYQNGVQIPMNIAQTITMEYVADIFS